MGPCSFLEVICAEEDSVFSLGVTVSGDLMSDFNLFKHNVDVVSGDLMRDFNLRKHTVDVEGLNNLFTRGFVAPADGLETMLLLVRLAFFVEAHEFSLKPFSNLYMFTVTGGVAELSMSFDVNAVVCWLSVGVSNCVVVVVLVGRTSTTSTSTSSGESSFFMNVTSDTTC